MTEVKVETVLGPSGRAPFDDEWIHPSGGWTDLTDYVRTLALRRGTEREYDSPRAGALRIVFRNEDRDLDPRYRVSPLFAGLKIGRPVRVWALAHGTTWYLMFVGEVTSSTADDHDRTLRVEVLDGLHRFTTRSYSNVDAYWGAELAGARAAKEIGYPEWPTTRNGFDEDTDGGNYTVASTNPTTGVPLNGTVLERVHQLSLLEGFGSFFITGYGTARWRSRMYTPTLGSGPNISDNLSRTIVRDDFNRADSSTTLGWPWTTISGIWGVSGNKAYSVSGSGYRCAVLDADSSHAQAEAVMSGTALGCGVYVAGISNTSLLMAVVGSGTVDVLKRVSTTTTYLGNTGASTYVEGSRIRVRHDPAAAKVYAQVIKPDGTASAEVSWTVDAAFASYTDAGLIVNNVTPAGSARWDDAWVTTSDVGVRIVASDLTMFEDYGDLVNSVKVAGKGITASADDDDSMDSYGPRELDLGTLPTTNQTDLNNLVTRVLSRYKYAKPRVRDVVVDLDSGRLTNQQRADLLDLELFDPVTVHHILPAPLADSEVYGASARRAVSTDGTLTGSGSTTSPRAYASVSSGAITRLLVDVCWVPTDFTPASNVFLAQQWPSGSTTQAVWRWFYDTSGTFYTLFSTDGTTWTHTETSAYDLGDSEDAATGVPMWARFTWDAFRSGMRCRYYTSNNGQGWQPRQNYYTSNDSPTSALGNVTSPLEVMAPNVRAFRYRSWTGSSGSQTVLDTAEWDPDNLAAGSSSSWTDDQSASWTADNGAAVFEPDPVGTPMMQQTGLVTQLEDAVGPDRHWRRRITLATYRERTVYGIGDTPA